MNRPRMWECNKHIHVYKYQLYSRFDIDKQVLGCTWGMANTAY